MLYRYHRTFPSTTQGLAPFLLMKNELSSFERNGSEVLETRQRLIARYERIETDEREKEVWENDFPLMQIYNPLKDIRNLESVLRACTRVRVVH